MLTLAGVEPYAEAFDALPAAAQKDRKKAMESFKAKGFPNLRNEAWKYTNVSDIQNGAFNDNAKQVASFSDLEVAARLVFVDGVFDAEKSTLVDGVTLLADAKDAARYLSNTDVKTESAFNDLNAALYADGYAVVAEKSVDGIVHAVFIGSGGRAHPRNLIVAKSGAEVAVLEEFVGTGTYFINAATDVFVETGARVRHARLSTDSKSAYNISNTQVRVEGNGRYDNFALNIGAKLARNEIRCSLAGKEGDLHLLGVNLVGDADDGKGQHLDTTTFIDHAHADTTSNEVYKSVLTDSGEAVFQGKIEVRPDSQRIVGNQMSRALMLSPTARIDTKPELEIYADDVICSHGATVGDLDEEALFYLRSRGIGKAKAINMLVAAFVQDVIDELDNEVLHNLFSAKAAEWLEEA